MAMFSALMNDTMFSDLFDDPFFAGWCEAANNAADRMPAQAMMSTDVKETDHDYDVEIDMPGFKKDDINLELSNGYLTVFAHRDGSHEDKGEDGKWLRRERYAAPPGRSVRGVARFSTKRTSCPASARAAKTLPRTTSFEGRMPLPMYSTGRSAICASTSTGHWANSSGRRNIFVDSWC